MPSERLRIIIVGSSGHAKVVIDVAEQMGRYEIVGLIDRFRAPGEDTLGYSILGGEDQLPELVDSHAVAGCFVAIGDNHVRSLVVERVRGLVPSIPFVTLVHPSAVIARDVSLGEGTVVMGGAVINSSSRVGGFCLVNTASTLDHDSCLGEFASLGPGARIGGNVQIGDCSAIGIGATVVHDRRIGPQTVVGAGATVLCDLEGYRVAYGTPARVVRERRAGDKYL